MFVKIDCGNARAGFDWDDESSLAVGDPTTVYLTAPDGTHHVIVQGRGRYRIKEFLQTVQELVDVDGRVDVFEYLLAKVISQHLWDLRRQRAGKSVTRIFLD